MLIAAGLEESGGSSGEIQRVEMVKLGWLAKLGGGLGEGIEG